MPRTTTTRILFLLAMSLIVGGCQEEIQSAGIGEPVVSPEPVTEEPQPDPPPPIYDAEGNLLPSDVRVAGLTLPRGLEHSHSQYRRHIYRSREPRLALLRYFGRRLLTADVPTRGESVTYRNATVRDAQGGVVHLDVSIEPTSQPGWGTRVEIYERPPAAPPGETISTQEIQTHFERMMREQE